ncbi:MAG: hypothetical protein V7707_15855 [Motiliproteus sp.]
MPIKTDLTDPQKLRIATQSLTTEQLATVCDRVQTLIDERHQLRQQKLDESNIKQMRGLMSKAGISWEEFQDALK